MHGGEREQREHETRHVGSGALRQQILRAILHLAELFEEQEERLLEHGWYHSHASSDRERARPLETLRSEARRDGEWLRTGTPRERHHDELGELDRLHTMPFYGRKTAFFDAGHASIDSCSTRLGHLRNRS